MGANVAGGMSLGAIVAGVAMANIVGGLYRDPVF